VRIMAQVKAIRASLVENATVRRWISRTFIVSILVYLIVIGWLVADAVTGASKWAPYGVNIPAFIALIIASEVVITATQSGSFEKTPASGRHRSYRAGPACGADASRTGSSGSPSAIERRLRRCLQLPLTTVLLPPGATTGPDGLVYCRSAAHPKPGASSSRTAEVPSSGGRVSPLSRSSRYLLLGPASSEKA
jgi:hypothetical protein